MAVTTAIAEVRRHAEVDVFADLHERETERAATLAALTRASAGRGMALAFEAEAGVGKTSLLAAAAAEARAIGARVLMARGMELEQGLASGLAGQLFVPLLVDADEEERAVLLDGPAALAAPALRLQPAAASADPVGDALRGLYGLCMNLAGRGPLLLAVDDAHWADEASLRFLAHLAARLAGLPVLVLIAARPAEPAGGRAVLQRLLADDAVEVHRPSALSEEATSAIVRGSATAIVSDELCRACHEATGGNPFLLSELLATLTSAHGDVLTADAREVVRLAPRSVASGVLVRLARLAPEATRIAHAVALFPAGGHVRHVVALAGVDEDRAARAVDALTEVAILSAGRPLTFLHPIVRTAVYEQLPRAQRALMHLRAARLLRAEGASATDVAAHLIATEPGSDADAFEDLLSAAGAAVAAGAPASAIGLLDRALQEPVAQSALAAALHLRGVARMLAGNATAAADLRAAVEHAPAGSARAAVMHDLARCLGFALRSAEAVRLLDKAIADYGDDAAQAAERCRLDRTWISCAHDDLAPRFVAEMRDLRAPPEPEGLLAHERCTLRAHWLAWSCEQADEVVRLAKRGLADEVLSSGLAGLPAIAYATVALYLADRPADALAAIEEALAGARGMGIARLAGPLHLLGAGARIYSGQLAEAQVDLELATFSNDEPAMAMPHAYSRASRAIVALERSGHCEAESVLGDLSPAPTIGAMALRAARGRIRLAACRPDEALEDLRSAMRAARLRGMLNPLYLFTWGGDLALAQAAAGDRARALARADDDLRLARRFGAAGVLGSALRVAGLVRGGDDGVDLLRQATTTLAGSDARLVHAQALADLGVALRRVNRRAAAPAPLREAIDIARRCGADRLADHATDELRATGGRLRCKYVTGIEALTPSELRVARLAAEGLSNRAIAQQLFLTVRTVETHIGSALSKLRIDSRRQFAAMLEPQREAS